MLKRRLLAASAITGALVLLPALGATAAPSVITNGDFQANPVGSETITGWSTMNQLIDLGSTSIAGCTSKDTSDYTTLRDWDEYVSPRLGQVSVNAEGIVLHPTSGEQIWMNSAGLQVPANTDGAWPLQYGDFEDPDDAGYTITDFYIVSEGRYYDATSNTDGLDNNTSAIEAYVDDVVVPLFETLPDPVAAADNVPSASDTEYWDDPPTFETVIADGYFTEDPDTEEEIWIPLGRQALKLGSDLSADNAEGYVAHGPAVFSDVFTVGEPRTISLDWMAAAIEDDYHVLGYVVNVDTCEQIEVIDSTGEMQEWTTAQVAVESPGDYRFVFVAGSYDYSWGSAAGAVLFIDDIRSQPVIEGTALDLELDLDLGAPVSNATVQLSGGGLKPLTEWTAVMRSTPVTLATGVTDAQGNFFQLAKLPADVTPGQHTITLTGIAPDGSVMTDVAYITVAADGTLSYLSFEAAEDTAAAAKLPDTGAETAPLVGLGAALLVAGAALGVTAAARRRARSA